MKTRILDFIDFEKVNALLEGFNQSTGFVTAILDLEGNVLSKSGWRQICTEFHRIHPETSQRCTQSDTVLAGKIAEGEKYHSYKCLNGLVDVSVPIVIKGEHIANLFSGQFFYEEPDYSLFKKQAVKFGFDEEKYLKALGEVPIVSVEKVKAAMDFLLNMMQLITEITLQKLEQIELNEAILKSEHVLRLFVEHSPASIAMFDNNMHYLVASNRFKKDYKIDKVDLTGLSHYEVFPEISERWKEIHQRCLHGEIIGAKNDQFPRADGTIDWVRWEIRPWYESGDQIGGIILFSEVITSNIEDQEALKESERYNRMLFEQSASGLAVTSFDGRLLDINTAFSKIIGYTVEEAKALTYWDITSEKYQNQEQQQLESLAKTGKYGPTEKEFIHKDGHLVPVTMQGSIIERNNQNFIWSSVEDITERKLAEEKLKENTSLIRIAAESAKLGGWNVDLKENRSYWSDEVAAIHEMPHGYAPVVEDGINFYAPEWRERITKVFTNCAKNGIPYDEEMEIFTSTGKRVWVRTIGEAVKDEYGKIFKVQGAFQDISEKKMAESKSREKDLQFRKLSANVPDLIFQFTRRLDGTYCVPVASEGIKNIFGCSPEDVVDDFTPIGNVIYPADTERVIAEIEYSAKHLTYFTCEFRVQIPGRSIQWILSRSTPEKLPDGSITWYGFNADITQRKQSEENQAKTNKLVLDMMDNSNSLIYLVGTDGRILMVNSELAKLFGKPRTEIEGKTRAQFLPNEIAVQHELNDQEVIKNRKAISFEEENLQPDGKHYYFTTKFPLIDSQEQLYGISGISTDITNQKLAEQLLRKSEKNYRTIFELSPIAAIFWDKEAKIIFWNKTAETIFGWSKEEVIGKKYTEFFIAESSRSKVEENIELLINNVSRETTIIENLRKDGTAILCEWSNTIICDKNGTPETIISLAKDVTEQKRADNQIKEQMEELRRWHEVTLNREGRILDLKQEVNELLKQLGKPVTYPSAEKS